MPPAIVDLSGLRIVKAPAPILSQTCEPFDFGSPKVDPGELALAMAKAMIAANGRGLAAPQVGFALRMFVMKRDGGTNVYAFNPAIVRAEGEQSGEEGCLSFPGLYPRIKRPASIEAVYWGAQGEPYRKTLIGIDARCFCHELDHLNGKTIIETAAAMAIILARKQAAQRAERARRPGVRA